MTFRLPRLFGLMTLACFGLVASCGDDEEEKGNTGECTLGQEGTCADGLECQEVTGGKPRCFCSPEAQTGCEGDLSCEPLADGNTGCFEAIKVTGRVFDLGTDEPIAGARVVARDANEVAVSEVVVTAEDGTYEVAVPTPRDAEGNPTGENLITLRADASGYLTFPKAPRVAIPVDTSQPGEGNVVASAATDIGLIAYDDTAGLGTVSGTVQAGKPWGTLVVAGGSTALADRDGDYVVYNVPAGSVTVSGYKIGIQLTPATADVTAGAETKDVNLVETGEATSVVSGNIQFANAEGLSETTVILAVEETFDPDAARGEAPPGLRVVSTGTFRFEGVPDGNYVVLAAFENDQLVRDPDQCIGGTEIVHITVPSADIDPISQSFKVTKALAVESPDGEEVVSATPTFVFEDDSSEEGYHVELYDAFGTLVWEDEAVPSVSGDQTVSVLYPGTPALESGMVYQFRATSYALDNNGDRCDRSRTEDLRGVFLVE